MGGLEARARDMGFERLHLDTATNQPEAIAFYKGLGYTPAGTESSPAVAVATMAETSSGWQLLG